MYSTKYYRINCRLNFRIYGMVAELCVEVRGSVVVCGVWECVVGV